MTRVPANDANPARYQYANQKPAQLFFACVTCVVRLQAGCNVAALASSWIDTVQVDALTAWRMETLAAKIDNMPAVVLLGAAAASGMAIGGVAGAINRTGPELPTTYNLPAIQEYWRSRPVAALKRSGLLLAKLSKWGFGVLADLNAGDATLKVNMPMRAEALRQIISDQGPAFVKVGQAVAIRPDLLPKPYLVELQKLLDQVQAFSSDEAKRLLSAELKQPLEAVFEDVRAFDRPVAAASIGQVYQATLKSTGERVAVKVQRPNILETVTLDIITIRGLAEAIRTLPGQSDAVMQVRISPPQGKAKPPCRKSRRCPPAA
ncbi:hypothetical protein CYMTET_30988, partial [Cymbomonas tetramitiformis]